MGINNVLFQHFSYVMKYFTHRNTPHRAKKKVKGKKALFGIFISFPFLTLNIMMKGDVQHIF